MGESEIKIATVAPIANGIFKETLSYFTSKDISIGSLVFAPVRSKNVPAVVIALESAEKMKTEIKGSDFSLRKLEKEPVSEIFIPKFVESAKETAKYFVTTTGQVIKALTQTPILKGYEGRGRLSASGAAERVKSAAKRHETLLLQDSIDERIAFYKRIVREEFAKKSSVFICVPTLHDFDLILEQIKKGIEDYTILLDPRLSAKKLFERWQKSAKEDHAVLIIGLPSSLSIPRHDLGMIIVEHESSPAYRTISRPFIDYRRFVKIFAEKIDAKLIFGDIVLRTETLYEEELGNYLPASPLKHRVVGNFGQLLVNMREEEKKRSKENQSGDISVLSASLRKLLQYAQISKEKTILVCARKGFATSTVCGDCGSIISCEKCGSSLVLYKGAQKNIYICHKCSKEAPAEALCKKCNSWRLKTLGFGVERVEEELRGLFPKAKIFKLDSDCIKTHKQGLEIINAFLASKNGILVGSEMALSYLSAPIENIAIVSIDPMLYIPDFRMDEKIFNLILTAKKSASKNFVLQTRCAEEPVIESAIRGDALEFYRREIRERKKFGYPPFKTLIKITHEGPAEETEKEMDELKKFLNIWAPEKYPAFGFNKKNRAKVNILIKLESGKWMDKNSTESAGDMTLPEILEALPPRFLTKIDPETIL